MGFQKGKHHKTLCNNWYFLNTQRLDLDSIFRQSWSHQSFKNGTPKDGTFLQLVFWGSNKSTELLKSHQNTMWCFCFPFFFCGPDAMSKLTAKKIHRQDVQVLHVHRVHLWVVHRGDSGVFSSGFCHMCHGQSTPMTFPYNRGWETQPKSVGVYIPIDKDSVIKGGMTISNIATFDHGTHDFPRQFDLGGMLHARRARRSRQTSLVCVAQRLDLCKGICQSSDNQMFKSESYVSTCLNQQLFCSSYFKKYVSFFFISNFSFYFFFSPSKIWLIFLPIH